VCSTPTTGCGWKTNYGMTKGILRNRLGRRILQYPLGNPAFEDAMSCRWRRQMPYQFCIDAHNVSMR